MSVSAGMPQINVPLGCAAPGIKAAAAATADAENKLRSFFAIWNAMCSSFRLTPGVPGPASAFFAIALGFQQE